MKALAYEKDLQLHLHNEFILNYTDYFYDSSFVYLAMEVMLNMTLGGLLDECGWFDEPIATMYAAQVRYKLTVILRIQ